MREEILEWHMDVLTTKHENREELSRKWMPRLIELIEKEKRFEACKDIVVEMDLREPHKMLEEYQKNHPNMGNNLWALDCYHVRTEIDLGNLAVKLFGDVVCRNCNHDSFCPKEHCLGSRRTNWGFYNTSPP